MRPTALSPQPSREAETGTRVAVAGVAFARVAFATTGRLGPSRPAGRRAGFAAACIAALALLAAAGEARGQLVHVVEFVGSVNPASSDFLQRSIAESERDGADLLVVQLDTPGGLVTATKDIIQAMLNSEVPIAVWVAPNGAWAASAGMYITIAAHVAAMAPGTTIGAAHPVSIGGGGGAPPPEGEEGGAPRDFAAEKAENMLAAFAESLARERERNVEWAVRAVRESVAVSSDEAVEIGVIDLIATSIPDLLEKLEGRTVKVGGEEVVLQLAGAEVRKLEMALANRLLNWLADPNVVVILFMAGLIGLYVEANQPGMIIPGVIGATCLILTAIGFQIIPFSWVGLLLVLAGIGFFVAEVFVTSYGALFLLGIASFLLGGSMLFDRPEVSDLSVSFWSVLVPAVTALSTLAGIVVYAVGRTLGTRQTAGVDEMIGLTGTASTPFDGRGTVFVRGEYWTAYADEPVANGDRVEVTGVDGLALRVRRAESPE